MNLEALYNSCPFDVNVIASNTKTKEASIRDDPSLLTHRLRPLLIQPPIKCLLIQASMSMGKSYRVEEYLARRFAQQPSTRVICVSARIQQGYTIVGQLRKFQFELYSHEEVNVHTCSRLVCQYESLHRLRNADAFDVLLIDEYRGVCGQVSAPTNLEMQSENFKTFLQLHQKASVCLLLDAFMFMDDMVLSVLKHCFPRREEVLVLVYEHTYLKRQFKVLPDEITFVNELLQHVALTKRRRRQRRCESAPTPTSDTKSVGLDARTTQTHEESPIKIGLICRTAAKLKHLMTCIIKYHNLQASEYLHFDGNSDDRTMSKFSHINESLDSVVLLGFTSKVTVGADIQVPFYRVFVEANGVYGPHVRDTFQMIGRFRKVTHSQVYILLPRNVRNYTPPNIQSELKRFKVSIAQKQQFIHQKSSLTPSHCSNLVLSPDEYALFLLITAIAKVENKVQWVRQFYLTCNHQMYPIEPYVVHHEHTTPDMKRIYCDSREESRRSYQDFAMKVCQRVIDEYNTDHALEHKKSNPYARIYQIRYHIEQVGARCAPTAEILFYCMQHNINVQAAIHIAHRLHYPNTVNVDTLIRRDIERLRQPSMLPHHTPIFSTVVELIGDMFNTWSTVETNSGKTVWNFDITDLVHNRHEIGRNLRKTCNAVDLHIENYNQHVEFSFISYFKQVLHRLGFSVCTDATHFYQCIRMCTQHHVKHCVDTIHQSIIETRKKRHLVQQQQEQGQQIKKLKPLCHS